MVLTPLMNVNYEICGFFLLLSTILWTWRKPDLGRSRGRRKRQIELESVMMSAERLRQPLLKPTLRLHYLLFSKIINLLLIYGGYSENFLFFTPLQPNAFWLLEEAFTVFSLSLVSWNFLMISHSFSRFPSFCWTWGGPVKRRNSHFSGVEIHYCIVLFIIAFLPAPPFLILDYNINRGIESEEPSTIRIKWLLEDSWINYRWVFIPLEIVCKILYLFSIFPERF